MIDILTSLLYVGIGFIAAVIGAVAGGGGGLLAIPALIFAGLPVNIAIATTRFGSLGFVGSVVTKFYKEKKIEWRYAIPVLIVNLIGVLLGIKILIDINTDLLLKVAGILMLTAVPFIFLKKFGLKSKRTTKLQNYLGYFFYFAIGIFSGVFGGGAGLFVMPVFIYFLGLTFIRANALDKFAHSISIVISIIILAYVGFIDYFIGFSLMGGMLIGGYVGAHIAIKKGNKFVRLAFACVVIISAIKLLFF